MNVKAIRPRRNLWRRILSDKRALVSLAYLLGLTALAVLAPFVAPYSPIEQDYSQVLVPPGGAHWLGTDDVGRDILSRLIYGAPASVFGSLFAVGVAVVIGLPVGLFAGYIGGRLDDLVGRVIDTLLSFPAIVLAIGVTGALGINLVNAMFAIGLVFSPILARLVRAQTLVVKNEQYVEAARCAGAGHVRLLWTHILPNIIHPVIVQITLLLAAALLAEASLSFLGLGVQPPAASWGGMLARAYNYMEISPWQIYPPGLAILSAALAFNALGESLRVLLDPTSDRR
ncbi:ABC transporter permease [Pusillimonas sp. MFBS29]|uniref:ABC transporter permease n=1 Tax=Pusillimonas sp. MFBS29 TaxID=2886690 RepID=UPI001D107EA2|nr:ABC transporter permease [Pusillimonas sp. MFBS29]MCC2595909.1 ABC transporter permease [Pusillimonas sp. MFBS29]